jgi:hypothetical protein
MRAADASAEHFGWISGTPSAQAQLDIEVRKAVRERLESFATIEGARHFWDSVTNFSSFTQSPTASIGRADAPFVPLPQAPLFGTEP